MTKLTIEDLTGDMPEGMIINALDDDRDGIPDEGPFQSALASGTEAIDASEDGVVISKPARIYNTQGVMS